MPDICDLILEEHHTLRRRFAELDEHHHDPIEALRRIWEPLARMLDRHAAAEEAVLYPTLLQYAQEAVDETDDAIDDHNKIRDAVRDADRHEVGTEPWWEAVREANVQNSKHIAEEERDALADFRMNSPKELREQLAARYEEFNERHGSPEAVARVSENSDPDEYIDQHR